MRDNINILHFDPFFGGESTLCKALSMILKKEYDVRIIHPINTPKSGQLNVKKAKWEKIDGEEFVSYDHVPLECVAADWIFCINGIHVKKSVYKENGNKARSISDDFFSQFYGKKFIFYEHGVHSCRLYNYERVFDVLIKNGNSVRVLTNTKEAIKMYDKKNYSAFLCRQAFNKDIYVPLEPRKNDGILNFCFNSRYTSIKGPHLVIPYFENFFKKGLGFKFNFRGTVTDPVSLWYGIMHYFTDNEDEMVMRRYAKTMSEIYEQQDYCVYAGYTTREEQGKMEYSVLEAIYYGIPLIVHPAFLDNFKCQEYGVSHDYVKTCFIELNEKNLDMILHRDFDSSEYVKNSKIFLDDFMGDKILERFDVCINSKVSNGLKNVELF